MTDLLLHDWLSNFGEEYCSLYIATSITHKESFVLHTLPHILLHTAHIYHMKSTQRHTEQNQHNVQEPQNMSNIVSGYKKYIRIILEMILDVGWL